MHWGEGQGLGVSARGMAQAVQVQEWHDARRALESQFNNMNQEQ